MEGQLDSPLSSHLYMGSEPNCGHQDCKHLYPLSRLASKNLKSLYLVFESQLTSGLPGFPGIPVDRGGGKAALAPGKMSQHHGNCRSTGIAFKELQSPLRWPRMSESWVLARLLCHHLPALSSSWRGCEGRRGAPSSLSTQSLGGCREEGSQSQEPGTEGAAFHPPFLPFVYCVRLSMQAMLL